MGTCGNLITRKNYVYLNRFNITRFTSFAWIKQTVCIMYHSFCHNLRLRLFSPKMLKRKCLLSWIMINYLCVPLKYCSVYRLVVLVLHRMIETFYIDVWNKRVLTLWKDTYHIRSWTLLIQILWLYSYRIRRSNFFKTGTCYVKISIQLFVHSRLTTISNEESTRQNA